MSLDTNQSTNFTDVNGHKIAWRSIGSGRPLVMLNRFRAAIEDWDPALINALAQNHQIITFDSAGVAASEGTVPDTLEGAADIAMAFSAAIGLDCPDVLGWSMGGMTAQILASKYSDQIGRVVLAGTTPSFAIDGTIPVPQEWLETATKEQNTPEDMMFLFYTDSDSSRAAGMSSLTRIGRDPASGAKSKTTMETIGAQGAATRKFFFGEDGAFKKFGVIDVPVLVANGDKDRAFAVENSMALARVIPQAQLAIYPDAGHAFLFQYADRFAQDVTEFLS
ncbi:MAG: alpha/beta hydrolase [Hyphomicrobiales bacterium]|uniref:alpha/beta fold hydrolase n=1 Tax=Shimia thalassica TaxID=1715693 RepID=UPI0032970EDD